MDIAGIMLFCWIYTASATTYYVAVDGNDTNPGSEALPFRAIQKAADIAQSGDTVLVKPGVYAEEIALRHSGVTLQAADRNNLPKIDGDNRSRRYGFYTPKGTVISDVTIDGFEIFGQDDFGILIDDAPEPYQSKNVQLLNNVIHHVRYRGIQMSGQGHKAEGNIIYMIGNSGESSGIQFNRVKDGEILDNQIYLVRKQCIRVRLSENVLVQDNVLTSAGNSGLAWNSVLGNNRAYNNYIYNIFVRALEAKHSNDNGSTKRNRFWHNTVYNTYGYAADVWRNDPPADYYDIRNNIFSATAHGHIRNVPPGLTEPHLYIDGNLYHRRDDRPKYVYGDQWMGGRAKTLAEMQSQTSFGDNGKEFDPQLIDPDYGQLDYPDTSPAAQGSLDLPSSFGSQLGARGLTPKIPTFHPIRLTAISASSNFSEAHYTTDWKGEPLMGVWHGDSGKDQWITYDLGSLETSGYILVKPGGHQEAYNIKRHSFEVSDDNVNYQTILSVTSDDDKGSAFIFELGKPVEARYLRYHMLESFGADEIRLAEIWIGNLINAR